VLSAASAAATVLFSASVAAAATPAAPTVHHVARALGSLLALCGEGRVAVSQPAALNFGPITIAVYS
jgi:hypothetical protein